MNEHSDTHDEDKEPIVWELRYEQRLFPPDGSWSKHTTYVYGTFEQAARFAIGITDPNRIILSLRMRPKIRRLYDLTDPE